MCALCLLARMTSGMKTGLSKWRRDLALGSESLLLGALFDGGKWEAYRDADVFVLPSQNENFGNTAAELQRPGRPLW